jgi:hypothetical protein
VELRKHVAPVDAALSAKSVYFRGPQMRHAAQWEILPSVVNLLLYVLSSGDFCWLKMLLIMACGQPKGSCPSSSGSIPCSGIDSSWYCSGGCTCNVSVDGGCNCFTSCDDSPGASSSEVAASSSTTENSSPAETSSTEIVDASTTQQAIASSTTDDSTPIDTTSAAPSVQTQTDISTSSAGVEAQSTNALGSTSVGSGNSGSSTIGGSSTTVGTVPGATTSANDAWKMDAATGWSLMGAAVFYGVFGMV